jgi:hypothetical protein
MAAAIHVGLSQCGSPTTQCDNPTTQYGNLAVQKAKILRNQTLKLTINC